MREGNSRRLAELGIALPPVPAPVASYVPAVRVGDLVHTSGQLPFVDGVLVTTGRVGAVVDEAGAAGAARIAALNALAAAAAAAGGIDELERVVKVTVFVASTHDFHAQPAVANGASHLIGEIFGEAGAHARSAVGVGSLPLDAPVEVELIAKVRSADS
ncbi:MAG: RidA family protein [Actinomycetes bacterium]|nr:RidA family protein [Actinomycetes bacterium]